MSVAKLPGCISFIFSLWINYFHAKITMSYTSRLRRQFTTMSGTSLMVMAWCCSMRKCMMWWLIANQWSSGEEAPPGQMQTGHRLWLSSALLYKFTQDPQRLSNSLYFVFFSVLCTSSWFLDIWIVHPTPTQLIWTMEENVAWYQMRAQLISFTLQVQIMTKIALTFT